MMAALVSGDAFKSAAAQTKAVGPERNFAKPTKQFHVYPFSVEAGTRWWDVKTYITPWERLFIGNR